MAMKQFVLSPKFLYQNCKLSPINFTLNRPCPSNSNVFFKSRIKSTRLFTVCCSQNSDSSNSINVSESPTMFNVEVGNPRVPSFVGRTKLSLSDQAFFLLAFIACTTSIAFTSLVLAAVPTLSAMGRAAISLSKLADTAREELPSTMAAIRLSGMEISDLTLELNDLSQEIADGVTKSAQAVQAAEAGIRQIGSLARHQTMSMIQERASLPVISLQPVVAGAAEKTSRAVGHARKKFMGIISRSDNKIDNKEKEDDKMLDRLDRLDI